jgi:hypothetical protein
MQFEDILFGNDGAADADHSEAIGGDNEFKFTGMDQ